MPEPLSTTIKVAPTAARGMASVWRWLMPDKSVQTLDLVADQLAENVKKTETRRLEQLGVTRGAGVDVVFDAPIRVETANGSSVGRLSEVGDYYRTLGTGRLVVTGSAGAGKTILGLHLLLDILDHRNERWLDRRPVPFRVNAASWDGERSFTDWLVERLVSEYSLRSRIARELADSGRILPVIDGLDEMDPLDHEPRRAIQAMDRLNENPWLGRPVVVMCRGEVFEQVRSRRGDAGLRASRLIEVQPIAVAGIAGYLKRHADAVGTDIERWRPVLESVSDRPDGVLATSLQTPWMLTLTALSLVNFGEPVARRLSLAADRAALQDELFAAMVPAAVQALPRKGWQRDYTVAEVHRWLINLARCMDGLRLHGRRAELRLDEVQQVGRPVMVRVVHCALTLLITAAVLAVFSFSMWAFMFLVIPPSLAAGTLPPPHTGLYSPKRLIWRTRRRGVLVKRLRTALIGSVWAALTGGGGALWAALHDPESDWPLAIDIAIGACLIGFVLGYLLGGSAYSAPRHEAAIVRDDALAGLTFATTVGGAILGAVWLFGRYIEWSVPLFVGTMIFVSTAFVTLRHLSAVFLFAITRTFPTRPAKFLNWAQESGLLRVTGTSYQFRHETFLHWLLANPDAPHSDRFAAADR